MASPATTTVTINFIAACALSKSATGHFQGKIGQSLMQAATQAGIDAIAADCGGSLTCATCHVVVNDAWAEHLPAPSTDELSMLGMTASERMPHSRLSCQIMLTAELDGLTIALPETQY